MSIIRKFLGILKNHKKKSIAAAIILALIGFGIAQGSRPKQPEYLTAEAASGDLTQTVEAVGTVVSERELELRFAGAGIVSNVYVKEGAKVRAGQRLAQLRSGSLGASVAAQVAAVQQAQIDLQALEQGNRPEDIAIQEAQVANSRAQLDASKSALKTAEQNLEQSKAKLVVLEQEADTALAGQVSTARSTLQQQAVSAQSALSVIDDVFGKTIVQDAVVKYRPGADAEIIGQKRRAWDALTLVNAKTATVNDYQTSLQLLQQAQTSLGEGTSAVSRAFGLIVELPETSYFTNSDRETYKTTLNAARSEIQSALTSLSTAYSAFQSDAAAYDTRLATERSSLSASEGAKTKAEADIRTFETALRTQEASLALKKAGARPTDIEAARARVRAAQANLARASADLSDTVLVAPIAGTVTHVNIRIGESLPPGAAVTLLGDTPFRVEMFVSEIDIPKVQFTQTGSIELDAFRGTHFALRVGEVDTASTDKDGVSKYRVKLDFVYPHNELKIGMTGDAEIVTGERTDVLHVPRRAVLEEPDGAQYVRVLLEDKTVEKRSVVIGMEGALGDVEILSGIAQGETVVVLEKK